MIPLSSFTVPCGQQQQQQQANATLYPRPNNGCPKLCLSGPRHPTETWIALIQRGQCEFVKKVREAQRLGAKAVVVGGEDPERTGYPDMLVNMYSPGQFYASARPARFLPLPLCMKSDTTHFFCFLLSAV